MSRQPTGHPLPARAVRAGALFAGALMAALGLASAASATTVTVGFGPELQRQAVSYGQRDVQDISDDLRKAVERASSRAPATAPQRADLIIEAATPNRPTFKQQGDQPGLSLRSVGLGGATITGSVVGADGVSRPISFSWYETDLRNERGTTTWTDADRAFDYLARRIAKGEAPNRGPYKPDLHSRIPFDRFNR